MENPEAFHTKNLQAVIKSQNKHKEEDIVDYHENNLKAVEKYQSKRKRNDKVKFNAANSDAARKCKLEKKSEIDEEERIRRFNYAKLFGPIFICSCCCRRLYENGVAQIYSEFKEKVNEKKAGFYNFCIEKEILVEIIYNGSYEKTGSYIYSTCRDSMIVGKIPAMAVINGLKLTPIRKDCQLTEFENNIIA